MHSLHISIGGYKDKDDKDDLASCTQTKEPKPIRWTIPKTAKVGDEVIIFIGGDGLFATANVCSRPKTAKGWKNRYWALIKNISLINPPISIDYLKIHLPNWTWLRYPRSYTTPPDNIAKKLKSILIKHKTGKLPIKNEKNNGPRIDDLFTKGNYIKALKSDLITTNQLDMLKANFYSKNMTITATQMAETMGWPNYSSANLHYGRLGKIIGDCIGYHNKQEINLYSIVTYEKPSNEWYWILRKGLADALLSLKIVEEKQTYELPEEITSNIFFEGSKKTIKVNIYERDKRAREECITHYRTTCQCCGFSFFETYGDIAKDFIHVHHIKPLSEIGQGYEVDPINDLIPLCPNCHSVVHLIEPPMNIDDLRAITRDGK